MIKKLFRIPFCKRKQKILSHDYRVNSFYQNPSIQNQKTFKHLKLITTLWASQTPFSQLDRIYDRKKRIEDLLIHPAKQASNTTKWNRDGMKNSNWINLGNFFSLICEFCVILYIRMVDEDEENKN